MSANARLTFAKNAINLRETHPQIKYKAIVVKKENVAQKLRSDSNKLYNYMTRLLLLDEMAQHPHVTLIPDARSIKVESGKSLHHYLEMMLYEKQASTRLETMEQNSKHCLNLQFTDMLTGVVGTHYEFCRSEPWHILSPHVDVKHLFF
jgi:hypothetical protein